MTAPTHINIGNIINGFPVLAFQQRRYACTIGSLRIAKDTEGCLTPCSSVFHALLLLQLLAVLLNMLAHKVQIIGFILLCSQQHCLIHHLHYRRHSITEKAADTCRNVNTRTLELHQRDNLQTVDTQATALVLGSNTHEIEEFGNTLTVAAHIRAGPEDHTDIFRIMTFLRNKAFYNLVAQRLPNLPSRRCRQTARVHTIEVAACRQQISTAAGGCTARSRLDIFALKATQHIGNLLLRQKQIGIQCIYNIVADKLQLFTAFCRCLLHPGQLHSIGNCFLDKVALLQATNKLAALIGDAVNQHSVGNIQRFIYKAAVFQQIVIIKAIQRCNRLRQTGDIAVVQAQQQPQIILQLLFFRRLPHNMQACVYLHILQIRNVIMQAHHIFVERLLLIIVNLVLQVGFSNLFEDQLLQARQIIRLRAAEVYVFVHELFQLLQLVIHSGLRLRCRQMLNQAGSTAALRLNTFARNGDVIRINIRQITQ